MSFLAPWAFFFAAIAPVIVLLYLLKLRRRREIVSTLLFWQRALQKSRHTALLQKLRNPLSLLLHLLIFALLLLALAKPVFDAPVRTGSSTVLIIDQRARMQARPNGASRFDEALRAATTLAAQASPSREFALLAAGADGRVITPFSSDGDLLTRALATLSVTDAGGSLESTLQLAANLLQTRGGDRRIVVLTSPSEEIRGSSIGKIPLEVRTFGTPAENTAITRFATRSLPSDPQSIEVFLELQHFGERPAERNLELSQDGQLLDVRPIRVSPGEPLKIFFPALQSSRSGSQGLLTARLAEDDVLPIDNTAFAVLPHRRPQSVLLVTEGNWFLEKLLQADTRVRYELLTPESFRAPMLRQFDVVIFDRFAPPDLSLPEIDSNALFIGGAPFIAGSPVEQPIITEVRDNHPALGGVNLRNVTIAKATGLATPKLDGWRFESLLSSFDHALLLSGENRRHRVAVLGFDLLESDLPLRVAFPLLVGNLVQWLGGDDAAGSDSVRAGELQPLDQPMDLAGPFIGPTDDKATTKIASLWQPLRDGFYQLAAGDSTRWVAVNTFDPAESDLSHGAAVQTAETPRRTSCWIGGINAMPWRYLALAAGVLLLLEWRLFHRRRTE